MGIKYTQQQLQELQKAWGMWKRKLKKKKITLKLPPAKIKEPGWKEKKEFKEQFAESRKTAEQKQKEEIEINRRIKEAKKL